MGYKPSFKQAYMNTYIGELPSIMNENFNDVSTALNNIVEYDVSGNTSPYVILPINTTGNVNANTGHFKNLVVDNNIQLSGSINIDVDDIKYDSNTTLKEKLDQIDASIKEIIDQLELAHVGGTSTNTTNNNVLSAAAPITANSAAPVYASLNSNDANLYICALNANDSYTYNIKYYISNAVVYDPSVFKYKADYNDVVNKNMYRYYTVNGNKYIKIDNEYQSAFRSCKVGDIVIPIFNPVVEHDFIISLGDRNITIKYEDYHLTTLQLICINVNDDGKCLFNIVNYNGKISVE